MFVRLTADPKGIREGTREAESVLTRFASGAVSKVTTALAGLFATREVVRFGVDVVKEFAQSEAIWTRLATAIDATGQSFDRLSPNIEQAARAMQSTTRFGDEEFAGALQVLVQQTGDVEKALSTMGLAADLAAAKGLSLESAADTLGKALAGNVTQLTRMLPALKGSTDLMGDLQKIVQGMAEKDAATLEGRLVQLNNAWGDFKEALGEALTGTTDFGDAVVTLTGKLQSLTTFVAQHRDAIDVLVSPLKFAASSFEFFATKIGAVVGLLQKAIEKYRSWRGVSEATGTPPQPNVPPATPLPVIPIEGFTVTALTRESQALARVWEGLTQDLKTADGLFTLFGDGQDLLTSKLAATTSAVEQLLRLGVDPMSAGVQKLAAEIKTLGILLTVIGERELEIPIKAITTFELSPLTPASVPGGGATEGALGSVGQALQDAVAELTGAFDSLLASLGPMAIVGEFLNGVFAALAPVLDALMVPIRNIGFLLASSIVPVLKLLQPILDGVAKVFSFVIQGIGEFLKGLGKAINFLLPGNPANGLVKFGQSMIDMAKQTRSAIDAGTDLTRTLDKVNASVSNVPRIFDLIARRRAAGSDLLPSGTAQARGGLVVNVNNPPAGVDAKQIARSVMNAILIEKRRGGVSAFDVAVAGSAE